MDKCWLSLEADNIRCIHCHDHEAAQQEAATELFPARHSKRYLHDDCVYVGHGANRELPDVVSMISADFYR